MVFVKLKDIQYLVLILNIKVMPTKVNEFFDEIIEAMDEKDAKELRRLKNKYNKYFKAALDNICNSEFSRGRDTNIEFSRLSD